MYRFATRRGWVVLALTVVAGCAPRGESGPKLTGRIQVDGQPCRPASLFEFDVKFTRVEDGPIKHSYLAGVEADGTFSVNGSIGRGIPPGRYKVSVNGPVLDAAGKPTRKYAPTFSDKNTPLEIEIGDSSQELTIDLEKKSAQLS